MSEALSSSEIEDVLSSIRRLVSDDMRPTLRDGDVAPAAAGDGEKLLLTPALRVVHSEPPRSEPPHDAVTAIDAVVSSVSAGMDRQDDDWESETGDLAPELPANPEFAPDSETAPMAEDVVDGTWQDLRIDAYAEPVSLRQVPEDHGFSGGQDHAETHDFTTIRSVSGQAAEVSPSGWAQGAADAEDASDPDADEATDDLAPDPWSGATIEPDRAWADEAEAAVLQELSGALPPLNADEFVMNETDDPDELEVPVDEAMLREIVRDVLREELQGRLGERITRNIRKLVRAEIARVMAEEDLL